MLLAAATESQVPPAGISATLPLHVGVGPAPVLLATTTEGGGVTGRVATPQLEVSDEYSEASSLL